MQGVIIRHKSDMLGRGGGGGREGERDVGKQRHANNVMLAANCRQNDSHAELPKKMPKSGAYV